MSSVNWTAINERQLQEGRAEVAEAEARLLCIMEEEARGLPSLDEEIQAHATALRKPRLLMDSGEQAWSAAGIRRHLSDLFNLHFKTPLHARLRLVNRGKAQQGYTPDLLRQNFLQLFGIDLTGEQVKGALKEYWTEATDLVDVGRMLDDLMGQGCPSLTTASVGSIGASPPCKPEDGGSESAAACTVPRPPRSITQPNPIQVFEEALRNRVAQGSKAITQVYHLLTLLGGRPTCSELRARLRVHLDLALPDEVLPLLLDAYAAAPTSPEDGLLPRIHTLRYLQERILGEAAPALPPLASPPPAKAAAATEEVRAAAAPAHKGASLVVLPTEAELEEALRWSIVRKVPGRAGLLRDACWLFGMGASGTIGLPAFASVVRDTFLLTASPEHVEALWRRLGERPMGSDEPVRIFTLLRRLLEERGMGQGHETMQDAAWERLVATAGALQTARRAQLTRLPLTGQRQMSVWEVVGLMAQDVDSRHRSLLHQLQYVGRVYDPAGQGLVTLPGLRKGLARLGLELSASDALHVLHAFPCISSSSSVPLRPFLDRLADPTPPASNPSLLICPAALPSQPSDDPSSSLSSTDVPAPPPALPPSKVAAVHVGHEADPPRALPCLVKPKEEEAAAEESRPACAVSGAGELQPSPPPGKQQQCQGQGEGASVVVAGLRRVPSGRGRMFAFRMHRLRQAQRRGEGQQPAAPAPEVSRTRRQLGLER